MPTYFAATVSRYVLVDAANESEARTKGQTALEELVPGRAIAIHTLRLATPDEIQLMQWHNEMVTKHSNHNVTLN